MKKDVIALKNRPRAASHRNNFYLADIIKHAPVMIGFVRGPHHIFELANPFYLKVIGKSEDIIGRPVAEVFPESKDQNILGILDNVYKTGELFIGKEVLVKLDTGSNGLIKDRYFNFVYKALRNTLSEIEGILIYALEVTDQVVDRKKAEESRRQFVAAFDQAAVGMAHTSLEGRWIEVNQKLCDMLEYNEKELLQKSFQEVTHPSDLTASNELLASFIQKKQKHESLQKRYITKSGKIIWTNITVALVRDENEQPKYFSTVIQDISKQKDAEEKLRESEERFALAQQAANIGTFDWNIKSGEFVCTPQLEALCGLPPGGLGGNFENWLNVLHADDRKKAEDEVRAAVTDNTLDSEYRVVWPDSTVHWVAVRGRVFKDKKGNPERLLGINRNVTKRKQAEESLFESKEQFRQLADSMPQMVWTARDDGYLDYYNKQWYTYTGFGEKKTAQSWDPILHPEDIEHCRDTWHHSVSTGEPYQIEYRFKDRFNPGSYRWFLGRALPIKDTSGKIIKWFGTCTDIDDIKRTTLRKKELEKITSTLTQQRKQLMELNEAKDEFISLASHQLRTPATGVKQYVGMMLEGYLGKLTKEQKTILGYAYESNERQLNIVDDLLKVARVDAGKVKLKIVACNMTKLITDVLHEQLSTFKKREQKIIFDNPPETAVANIDRELLRMVLENLIDNASKYTPIGKSIAIKLKQANKHVVIVIKDQGVGIAKEDQAKLFQKFSRIHNSLSTSVGGTGLGLYWAKKIIDLHQGTLELTSEVNKGSMFTLKIPTNIKESTR